MPASTATGHDVAARAFTRVIDVIEPLTRYDRTSLILDSALSRTVVGHATWRYSVSLKEQAQTSTGRLPHCQRVSSQDELLAASTRSLKDGYSALPHRLQTWLTRNDQTDSRLLASDCFDGPKTFGYELMHSPCDGRGWVVCPDCKDGYNTCGTCHGEGTLKCTHCQPWFFGNLRGPKGTERCPQRCNCGKDKDGKVCGGCNGLGKVKCTKCEGDLKLRCPVPRCSHGRIAHKPCEATGRLKCEPCDGTGYHHCLQRIECSVTDTFCAQVADPNREVVSALARRDLAALRTVATARRRPTEVGTTTLLRHYEFECAIGEIVIAVRDQRLAIVSYGANAYIEDYKDIIKHLLEPDRVALRAEVASSRVRLWGNPETLIAKTRLFLESEINMTVENPEHIRFRRIDDAYVAEATKLLRSALFAIFASRMGGATLLAALTPAIWLLTVYWLDGWTVIGNWLVPMITVTVAAGFWLFERHARGNLVRLFDTGVTSKAKNLGMKTDTLFAKYLAIWKLRGIAIAAAVTTLSTVAMLISAF